MVTEISIRDMRRPVYIGIGRGVNGKSSIARCACVCINGHHWKRKSHAPYSALALHVSSSV